MLCVPEVKRKLKDWINLSEDDLMSLVRCDEYFQGNEEVGLICEWNSKNVCQIVWIAFI